MLKTLLKALECNATRANRDFRQSTTPFGSFMLVGKLSAITSPERHDKWHRSLALQCYRILLFGFFYITVTENYLIKIGCSLAKFVG